MDVGISIVQNTITLGQTITVNYSSTGAEDTQISADCLINPIDLGSGDVSGTVKLLPVASGTFTVSIQGGFGEQDSDGNYYKSRIESAQVQVN